jgi:P27 family predicted phage terminase small subunit
MLPNEMEVSTLVNIPDCPLDLNEWGRREWEIVTHELLNKKMLHLVDLALVSSYANEMGLYFEMENFLNQHGRIDEFYNDEGLLTRRSKKPEQAISKDALANAMKLAAQFGLTPSARTRISMPTQGPKPLEI